LTHRHPSFVSVSSFLSQRPLFCLPLSFPSGVKTFESTGGCTAVDKSLDGVQGSQYGFNRYVRHVTGWFTGALPGSASLSFCPRAEGMSLMNSPRTPGAASAAGLRGRTAPIKPVHFTHSFFRRARSSNLF
jgi:hypothetical protein